MALVPKHLRLQRIGACIAAAGFALATLALANPSAIAGADVHVFQGNCVGNDNAGTCVLDEPEGNNPATHGTASYLRSGTTIAFTINALDPITEVQICMQASGPFAEGANVCAGIHGHHVAFTHVGNVYTVDLDDEGFADTSPLYWTLHVVAGGRTLQVIRVGDTPPPTTTTTTIPATTTTTDPGTTTTVPPTTTTTEPPTTTTTEPPTTTTAPPTTTTTVAPTTTTTEPPTTTTTVLETTTTTVPDTTTTTAPATTTTTTALSTTTTAPTTTTTLPIQVLGQQLARTGGPQWWMLVAGAWLLIIGLTLTIASRFLEERLA